MSPRKIRSTAFALLAKREHSQKELTEKLVSYGADEDAVKLLLQEFSHKDYQSDDRMSGVLMRHSLNKGQGLNRIKHSLKKHDLTTDAIAEDLADVNWLAEAIKARQKRFGNAIPHSQKDKAKQLRFLQYRGFTMDVCYKAIKTNDCFYE